MKRLSILSILLLLALCATANNFVDRFQLGDLYYSTTSDNTVEVTYQEYNSTTNYQGLTTATIPAIVTYNGVTYSVTGIGDYTFWNCSSLTSITIPNSVTSIGDDAFKGCSSLTSIVWNAKNCNNWSNYSSSPFYNILSNITSFTFGEEVETIPSYICDGMTSLTSVTIGNSVTSIGDYAFEDCSALTSITIPNSVTSIGDYAFSGCSSLTSLTISNSVTIIGNCAFDGCSSLTSITVPNSVTSIGDYAFNNCSSLTSITIPNSVTSIGYEAFRGCSSLPVVDNLRYADTYLVEAVDKSLSTYTIKAGTKWIGEYAFKECSSLTSITIPNSVVSIGDYAFEGCSALPVVDNLRYADTYLVRAVDRSLSTYTIKAGTKWIGSDAFYYCKALTSLTIPNSVTSIGSSAFKDCSALTSITIPNSVTSIKGYTFYNCSRLTAITIPNSVTSIGYEAFYGCSSLTSITIPNSVTSIGSYAFKGCSRLTSIAIGNSVTSIGNDAFSGCSSLTSVAIGNSVTSIGSDAFSGCSSLTSVVWNAKNCGVTLWSTYNSDYYGPFASICSQITSFTFGEEVETIPSYLCYGMTSLTSITIPDSVTSIGYRAFYGCSGLTSVTIGNSVTSIKSTAFVKCSSLTSVVWNAKNCGVTIDTYLYYGPFYYISSNITSFTFGEEVETIPAGLCYGMESLTSITIPNSVTSIGDYAFRNCSSLTSITIPNSVTIIGDGAFIGCSSLTSLTIPNSVTSIGQGEFGYCTSLTSLTIPNSVTSIGSSAFYRCTSLTSITIPESITSIESEAFYYCSSLTSITIPNSVTSIGSSAFNGCSSLTTVTSMSCTPPDCGSSVFSYTPSEKTLVVPNSSLDAYMSSSPWNTFTTFESIVYPTLSVQSANALMGTAHIDQEVDCDSIAIISAVGNLGYAFTQWTDGNTDNPRTVLISQDTLFTAEFAMAYSGKCGDDLYWEYSDKALSITGNGTMYDYSTSTIPWLLLCDSIQNITIGEDVRSIGSCAFQGCSSLTSITIPKELVNVYSLNPNAVYFVNTEGWSNIHVHAWGGTKTGTSWPGEIATKADFTYLGYDVYYFTATPGDYEYCIFNNGFSGTGNQTEDLTWTGGQAYFNDEWHTIQVDPSYKVAIGANAFSGCTSLRDITCLAVTPPTCGSNAFDNVPDEATLWCPCESVEAYQSADGWSRFNDIRSIDFPQTILLSDSESGRAHIEEWICEPQSVVISATPNVGYAFTRWSDGNTENPRAVLLTQDTTLTAEFGLAYSGKCGDNLYWEYKDKALTITGSGTMYNYTKTTMPWLYLRDSIYSVPLPKEITSIGSSAFEGCSALTSITIPNSVTSIGSSAFYGCSALTRTNYTGDIAGWCALQFDNETANPTYYSKNLFISDVEIKGSQILNSITSIGQYAFYNCSSISSVTLGNSVTSIGNSAFYKCSLADIYCYATTPPVCKTNTFNGVSKNCYIHVPTGTVRSYQLATGWSDFNYFFEISEEQALPATQQDNQPSRKIIRNGQVLIIRNGETYDMMGQKL